MTPLQRHGRQGVCARAAVSSRAQTAPTRRQVELYSRVNVGIAVAARDALLVPTVFDADRKGLRQIARESRRAGRRGCASRRSPRPSSRAARSRSPTSACTGSPSSTAVINPPRRRSWPWGRSPRRPVVRAGRAQPAPADGASPWPATTGSSTAPTAPRSSGRVRAARGAARAGRCDPCRHGRHRSVCRRGARCVRRRPPAPVPDDVRAGSRCTCSTSSAAGSPRSAPAPPRTPRPSRRAQGGAPEASLLGAECARAGRARGLRERDPLPRARLRRHARGGDLPREHRRRPRRARRGRAGREQRRGGARRIHARLRGRGARGDRVRGGRLRPRLPPDRRSAARSARPRRRAARGARRRATRARRSASSAASRPACSSTSATAPPRSRSTPAGRRRPASRPCCLPRPGRRVRRASSRAASGCSPRTAPAPRRRRRSRRARRALGGRGDVDQAVSRLPLRAREHLGGRRDRGGARLAPDDIAEIVVRIPPAGGRWSWTRSRRSAARARRTTRSSASRSRSRTGSCTASWGSPPSRRPRSPIPTCSRSPAAFAAEPLDPTAGALPLRRRRAHRDPRGRPSSTACCATRPAARATRCPTPACWRSSTTTPRSPWRTARGARDRSTAALAASRP